MICPDCNEEMIKVAIQCSDCSGWMVGWMCECLFDDENIQLKVYSDRDWTADKMIEEINNDI